MRPDPSFHDDYPLCVDLDGTYLRSDTTWDLLCRYLSDSPWSIARVIYWLSKGRSYLKFRLSQAAALDLSVLPRNAALLAWLKTQPPIRPVVLVSGATQSIVDEVVSADSTFSAGYGSTERVNLTGETKASFLVEKFGREAFDYVGNSRDDIPVWRAARRAYGVQVGRSTISSIQQLGKEVDLLDVKGSGLRQFLRALRIHQWVKNLLCIVPVVASHRWGSADAWLTVLPVFLLLCLSSSAIYLGNDLKDLDADRRHPTKRSRPLAAGEMSIKSAIGWMTALVASWIVGVTFVDAPVVLFMLIQVVSSVLYTAKLKAIPVLDVIWLGLLYCNRIIIGSVALSITPTAWLIAFALFFFVGIACTKRYGELSHHSMDSNHALPGRGYRTGDDAMIRQMGYGSSMLSVMVFALYIAQPEINALYRAPGYLWLICVILFYWVSRLWMQVNRDEFRDDPLEYILNDKVSYFCALAGAIILVISALNPLGGVLR